jgi:hypothetical protein
VTSRAVHAEVSWRKAVAHLKEAAAKDDRNAADYDEAVLSSPEDARESSRSARDFLTVCDARHGFGLSLLRDS